MPPCCGSVPSLYTVKFRLIRRNSGTSSSTNSTTCANRCLPARARDTSGHHCKSGLRCDDCQRAEGRAARKRLAPPKISPERHRPAPAKNLGFGSFFFRRGRGIVDRRAGIDHARVTAASACRAPRQRYRSTTGRSRALQEAQPRGFQSTLPLRQSVRTMLIFVGI